ncbi:uncharacterized protein [Ptychodera flava]|uniref:uncharacterized protein n=1 Tax=Ptychodera flava TaxID=63121 RepID=UPI00396A1563
MVCQTEDDQDRYIREYFDREGILLDKTKIHRNPGQRALAKLMLNSMWGKFAQRNNFPRLQYIKEPAELFRLLTSEQHIVNNLSFVNDDMIAVQHTLWDEFVEGAVNTNVVIAAFTTAYARLKLYDLLEALGERVLYFDTDSVIFVSKPDQYEPPLGDYLGDLTNELDPPSNFITKFVSGGAKKYAFCLAQPDRKGNTTVCKVRGITLNYRNSLDVNFDAITRLVTTCPTSTITVNDPSKSDVFDGNVVSKSDSKKDGTQITHLVKQMYPGHTRFIQEAFTNASREPYGYLLIDLKPNTPEVLRLRTNIFPGETAFVYVRKT